MQYEYHVAYWIGPILVSGVNVTAENDNHAIQEAMTATNRNVFVLHYIHNRTTNKIVELHERSFCAPIIKR